MSAKKTLELSIHARRTDSATGELEAEHRPTFTYIGVSREAANQIDASLVQAMHDHALRMVELGIEHAKAKAGQ